MVRKFPVLATICCFLGVCMFLCLGIWQVQRLTWKEALQGQLDHLMAQTDLPSLSFDDFESRDSNLLARGVLTGTFLYSKAQYLNGYVIGGRAAFPVVVPMRPDGTVDYVVAVVVWVERSKNSGKWAGIPDWHGAVTGLVRLPERSIFRPENVAEKGEWWTLDVGELAKFWGFSDIAPVVLYAENVAPLGVGQELYPIPVQLRNDHEQYAWFWFMMAGILCVVWWGRFLKPYLQSA